MTIKKTQNGSAMEIALKGRLDTESAPQLDKALEDVLKELDSLTLDCAEMEYISSAGLRSILKAKRGMKYGGTVTVKNANEIVQEVFTVTGFVDYVTLA